MTIYAPALELGQYFQTPDIIWNTVSRQFVVGFAIAGLPGQSCSYFNMLLSGYGAISRAPLAWGGQCDNDTNGAHHTSVAFDSDATFNPSGVYEWWYMGPNGKGVYDFDAWGMALPNAHLSQSELSTRPVTSLPTHRKGKSYAVGGVVSPYVRHFTRAITGSWTDVGEQLGFNPLNPYPLAIRGIASGTAVVTQSPNWDDPYWFVSVSGL